MSKIIGASLALILTAAVIFGGWYILYAPKCDTPIKFSMGTIDPRFKLDDQDLQNVARDSANRWNEAVGRDLFSYDTSANLKVNFIYDSRQQQLDQLKAEISKIDGKDVSLKDMNAKLEEMVSAYQRDLAAYESELEDYNRTVKYWNTNGGAPAETYQELQSRASTLDTEKNRLDKQRQGLVDYSLIYDSQANEYNNDLAKLRQNIENNQNKLVTQGLYYPNTKKIEIFTFGDLDELRLVLMHELGHATGAVHTSDPNSIMNAILDNAMVPDPVPVKSDIELITNACNFNPGLHNWRNILETLRTLFISPNTQTS